MSMNERVLSNLEAVMTYEESVHFASGARTMILEADDLRYCFFDNSNKDASNYMMHVAEYLNKLYENDKADEAFERVKLLLNEGLITVGHKSRQDLLALGF